MRILLIPFILFIVLCAYTQAQQKVTELPSAGESYDIWEQDFEEFIYSKASGFNFKEVVEAHFDESFERAATVDLPLPQAKKDNIRYITLEHTLQTEIAVYENGKKNVIYPAGFKYNPLDYAVIYENYLVVNPLNPAQIEWLRNTVNENSFVIITEGNTYELSKELDMNLYVLSELVMNGLHIRCTPSKIEQAGNKLKISEFFLEND